jgi:hypothetical protein
MRNVLKFIFLLGFMLSSHSLKFDGEQQQQQQQEDQQSQQNFPQNEQVEGRQSARHLLDYIGLGTGGNIDPYLRRTNEKCLNGELAECFKSQALNSVDEIFYRDAYT